MPLPTLVLTPWAVFIQPYTSQGWRAVSVNSQPKEFASSGSAMVQVAIRSNQLGLVCSLAPALDPAHAPMSRASTPKPIIRRKNQYAIQTTGT